MTELQRTHSSRHYTWDVQNGTKNVNHQNYGLVSLAARLVRSIWMTLDISRSCLWSFWRSIGNIRRCFSCFSQPWQFVCLLKWWTYQLWLAMSCFSGFGTHHGSKSVLVLLYDGDTNGVQWWYSEIQWRSMLRRLVMFHPGTPTVIRGISILRNNHSRDSFSRTYGIC